MHILVCPTAFKGTLTAAGAAEAMARGVREAHPEVAVRVLPLSDGGPGLLDALRGSLDGEVEVVRVRGPLSGGVEGRVLRAGGEAVLESADACGLHLLRGRPRPLEAHTVGVGELVRAAIEGGSRSVRIGLGGSASTDGGTGMARAFGWRFLAADGGELPPGGGSLRRLAAIRPGRRPSAEVTVLADVEHALVGPRGAARTFAPQKGAGEAEVEALEAGLRRLAERIREDLRIDVAELPGGGAAGGLGAGCAAFLGAEIVRGSRWVLERVGFDGALAGASLVVTGEGAFDATSRTGKVVGEVLERAAAAGVPALLVCGRVERAAPDAALALDGGGEPLDEGGLTRLVAEGARRLPDRRD